MKKHHALILSSRRSLGSTTVKMPAGTEGMVLHVSISGSSAAPIITWTGPAPTALCILTSGNSISYTCELLCKLIVNILLDSTVEAIVQSSDALGLFCQVPDTFDVSAWPIGAPHNLTLLRTQPSVAVLEGTVSLFSNASWQLASSDNMCAHNASVSIRGSFDLHARYQCMFMLTTPSGSRFYASPAALLNATQIYSALPHFNTTGASSIECAVFFSC